MRCAHNGLRVATGALSGGVRLLVHYLLTRRKFETAAGSKSNLLAIISAGKPRG